MILQLQSPYICMYICMYIVTQCWDETTSAKAAEKQRHYIQELGKSTGTRSELGVTLSLAATASESYSSYGSLCGSLIS